MGGLIAPNEVVYLVTYLFLAMTAATGSALLFGRLRRWQSPRGAIVFGSIIIPLGFVLFAIYVRAFSSDGPPPNDAKGMAVLGLLLVAALTSPLTTLASVIAIRRVTR